MQSKPYGMQQGPSLSAGDVAVQLSDGGELYSTLGSIALGFLDVALHIASAAFITVHYYGSHQLYWLYIIFALCCNLLVVLGHIGLSPTFIGRPVGDRPYGEPSEFAVRLQDAPVQTAFVLILGLVNTECLVFLSSNEQVQMSFRKKALITNLVEGVPSICTQLAFFYSAGWASANTEIGSHWIVGVSLFYSTAHLLLKLPIIGKAREQPEYAERFKGSYRRFADFAPFLIVNRASASAVAKHTGCENYPIGSFRGNIVVRAPEAWAEESWARIEVQPAAGVGAAAAPLSLTKIKECPRCTVPCRDGLSGGWILPNAKLKLWTALKKVFPAKTADAEWGEWAGVFFGVYFGFGGGKGGVCGATLSVGDSVVVLERRAWDAHLRRHWTQRLGTLLAMLAAALVVAFAVGLPHVLEHGIGLGTAFRK